MKILERKELSVIGVCPHCGSKLELEKGDIWWHKDIDGGKDPCVTCAACGKGFSVEGWKNISKLYISQELAESEDARMKESIIATIHLYYGEPLEDEAKKMIAWLEKRDEQESARSEEDKSYLLDFTRWFEQKAKAYDINLPMRGFDICAFCKEIIERLRICENLVWENIDETQRTNAIIMLKEGARRVYAQDSIDKCVDWLKSLRPQSQWKPSDMELEVLRLAAEKDGTCLMGLYEQLKKLREE